MPYLANAWILWYGVWAQLELRISGLLLFNSFKIGVKKQLDGKYLAILAEWHMVFKNGRKSKVGQRLD